MSNKNFIPKIEVTINNTSEVIEGSSCSILIPSNPTPEAAKLIDAIGIEAYNAILAIEHLKREIQMEKAQRPHVLFQIIRGFISILITENPNHMHWDIIKVAIEKSEPLWAHDTSVRDDAARELINQCEKLKSKLAMPKTFKAIFVPFKKECDKEAVANGYDKDPILEIIPLPFDFDSSQIDSEFEQNGLFIWDRSYLNLLRSIGEKGSELAKEGKQTCQDFLSSHKAGNANPLTLWLNLEDHNHSIHQSPFLIVLAQAILSDVIKKHKKYRETNVPAVTTTVQKDISLIHSPKNKTKKINHEMGYAIELSNQKYTVAIAPIPVALQPKIVRSEKENSIPDTAIERGMIKLQSVVGCKLHRFLIRHGFNQLIQKKPSDQLILNRGLIELAEKLGISSKRQIGELGDILQAYAFGKFDTGLLKGNLIILNTFRSQITGREGILIKIGPAFLPSFIHSAQREIGRQEMLVAVPEDPPLINPSQYFASQYHLQMLVMVEFSNQSKNLVEENKIHLPMSWWEDAASKCEFPIKLIPKIIDRWTRNSNWDSISKGNTGRDVDDAKQFLINIDEDYYTLASAYEKERLFYLEQGKRRIWGVTRAKLRLSNIKKGRKKKKYVK